MKYSVLGVLGLVLTCHLTAPAQTVKTSKPTSQKAAAHKKNTPVAEAAPAQSSAATIIVPSWLPPTNPVQPTATIVTDVLDTKLDVKFDWAKQWLLGNALLTLRPHFYPQNQVVLDAKGFDVKSVRAVIGGKEKNLNYTYDKRKLTISLDRMYARNEQYQVRISYVAKPNELEAGGSAAITSSKGLYFINPLGTDKNKPRQIWTQGETEANSCWFPTIDKPNQRMTQEITMTVDGRYKTLSNGLLISSKKNADGTRTDIWKQTLPAAPYLTMMTVGEFAVINDTWRGKAVDYYVEPGFQGTAKAVFGNTPEMLDFFSRKLGVDFPWEKYAQVAVRDFVSGAMENTTATTIRQEWVQLTKRELPDQSYQAEGTIAHEVFHQWFGDYVTSESWSNLPLNESFADYSELLWAEHKYGADAAALVQQQKLTNYLTEAESKREPLIRYHYATREDMFDRHSYDKGGRVLHMLRKYVGDEAFFASLNRYLTQNKFSSSEIAKLRLAFEETTGEDLMWFFDQWFMQRGHPELYISHTYTNGQVNLRVEQRQDSTFTPIYRLPVTVSVWTGNQSQPTDYKIVVTKANQMFTLPASQRPNLVKFDAEGQLLAKVQEQRTQDELLFQYYHARNYLQKYEAIDQLRGKLGDLAVSGMLRNAMNDPFWAVRLAAVEGFRRYKGPEGNAVRKELRRAATTDKKSQVRAMAVTTLGAFLNEDFSDVYATALNDSSYLVVGAAINALARNPSIGTRDALNALQDTHSPVLLNALSNYYSLNGTADQYQWFLRRMNDVSEDELYTYLQNFGLLMQRMPPVERDKGIQRLEAYARTHPNITVKLGAYRGLSSLVPSTATMKATLQDIRAKEKNDQLKAAYSLIQ
ncbi:aminopeptidase N [Hymenobacter daecheongensis DSM 21074]|uniref:Aminopeptidase N n=1 Tax=Hymenobacter daecheongensis DSM 21074 TaxID=1121955 RepID=A0A1M6DE81_9BACT|nr:M1 family aminopeptidase [Hymenobacter daecheongensis]SHI71480.1 aminopeptidase N [Hymenobacter daecheongensis DSM 21074]